MRDTQLLLVMIGLVVVNSSLLVEALESFDFKQDNFRQPKLLQQFQPSDALQIRPTSNQKQFKPVTTNQEVHFFSQGKIQEHQAIVNQPEELLLGRSGNSEPVAQVASCRPEPRRWALKRVLESAKNMLTGGFGTLERSALGGNLLVLGSSVLAAAIPLLAFLMPDFSSAWRRQAAPTGSGQTTLEVNKLSSSSGPLSLHGQLDSVMGWIERSICEAHNEPSKYGALGFILRLLFPASNLTSTDRMDNMDFRVINKYRHAAGFGASRRLESNNSTLPGGACKEKYEDCLVNLLDVSQSLMDIFLK